MAVQGLTFSVQPLQRSFRAAHRWLWLQTGLRVLARSLCVSLGFLLVAALLALFGAPDAFRSWFWLAAACTPAVGLVAALVARPSKSEAVRMVDLRLDLRQQLGTAQELLSTGSDGTLVRWQLAQAADLAGDLPISKAFPLVPKREILTALLLAAATAAFLELVSLGVIVPNPLASLQLPGLTRGTPQGAGGSLFAQQGSSSSVQTRSPALEPTRQLLSEIQKQYQQGGLSQQSAAGAIQQANDMLNQAAQNSDIQQQALNNLATNLRDTAAGSDIAQSLLQEDYQKAAQQLRDLGNQTDQLSPAARQQLTQALRNSAAQSQGLQQLARAENWAAQSVQSPSSDYYSTQSMNQLAQAVQDAGSQVIPQSDLANTWQQLNDLNNQLSSGSQSAAAQATTPPQASQGPDGTGQQSVGLQQGQPSSNGQPSAAADPAGSSGNGSGQMPANGGLAGNGQGGPALGAPNPRLGPDGKPLDISGKIAGQFSGQPPDSSTPPSVLSQGSANSTGSNQASGAQTAPAENVFVPGDQRPVVRDYFSGGTGSK